MKLTSKFAVCVSALALALTPTVAFAQGTEYTPAHPEHPAHPGHPAHPEHPGHPAHPTPGPKSPLPEKAKAYGVYCRGFSKKHAAGEKGTPFSQCVTAMAKAVSSDGTSARQACRGFSKKHAAGEKGTPFSRCVVAASHAKKAQGQS